MKKKIELTKLYGDDVLRFGVTMSQLTYLRSLMIQRGLGPVFNNKFCIGDKLIRNHITKASASKLIDCLKANKEFEFIEPQIK